MLLHSLQIEAFDTFFEKKNGLITICRNDLKQKKKKEKNTASKLARSPLQGGRNLQGTPIS